MINMGPLLNAIDTPTLTRKYSFRIPLSNGTETDIEFKAGSFILIEPDWNSTRTMVIAYEGYECVIKPFSSDEELGCVERVGQLCTNDSLPAALRTCRALLATYRKQRPDLGAFEYGIRVSEEALEAWRNELIEVLEGESDVEAALRGNYTRAETEFFAQWPYGYFC